MSSVWKLDRKTRSSWVLFGWPCWLFFVALAIWSCGSVTKNSSESEGVAVPYPEGAIEPRAASFPDGTAQASFRLAGTDRSLRVIGHYESWATSRGWKGAPSVFAGGNSGEWLSYTVDGVEVSQRIEHWASPDGAKTLHVILRDVEGGDGLHVIVLLFPSKKLEELADLGGSDNAYDWVESTRSQASSKGLATDSSQEDCAEGFLVEPSPVYQPMPSDYFLRQKCEGRFERPAMRVEIEKDGTVSHVRILNGSGCEFVDKEAMRCLATWKFRSATCRGEPIRVWRGVVVHFPGYPSTEDGNDYCPRADD